MLFPVLGRSRPRIVASAGGFRSHSSFRKMMNKKDRLNSHTEQDARLTALCRLCVNHLVFCFTSVNPFPLIEHPRSAFAPPGLDRSQPPSSLIRIDDGEQFSFPAHDSFKSF